MAVLLGCVLEAPAALFRVFAALLDVIGSEALRWNVLVSWEFLILGLALVWYGRGGQLFLLVSVAIMRDLLSVWGLFLIICQLR